MRTIVQRASLTMAAMLFGVVTLFGGQAAYAVDGESITMTPTAKRYSLDPGASLKDTLTVVNTGSEAYSFSVYARPYSVKDSSYTPDFGTARANADAYKWVQFDETQFTIKPNQEVKVPYTLTVPANADSGGHFGVLFAETQPSDGGNGSVIRKKRVGAITYVTVKGDNKSSGSVVSSSLPFLQTSAPLSANSTIKNDGNVDFVVNAKMVVKDLLGSEKYKSERDLAVLPDTSRDIAYAWQNGPTFGLYNVTVTQKFLDTESVKSGLVLLVPVWVLVLIAAVVVMTLGYVIYRNTVKKPSSKSRAKVAKK